MPPSNNMQAHIAPDDASGVTQANRLGSDDDSLRSALTATLDSGLAPFNNPDNDSDRGSIGSSNVTASPASTAPGNSRSRPKTNTLSTPPEQLFVVHPRVFRGKLASSVPRSAFFSRAKALYYAQEAFKAHCRRTYYDYIYYGPTELKRGKVIRYTARDAKTGERLMLVDVLAVNVLDVGDWWAELHVTEQEDDEDAGEEEVECTMEGDDEEMRDEVEEVGDDDGDERSYQPYFGKDWKARGQVDDDEQQAYKVEDEESQEEWMSDGEGSGMEETEDMKVFRGRR